VGPLALDRAFEQRGGRVAHVRSTTTAAGDLSVLRPGPDLDARRRALVDAPWTWLRQVHGPAVVAVAAPGEHAGAQADAAVTAVPCAALAVHTADCAPIALVSAEGPVAAVHAGWRGLAGGVIEATVAALRAAGAGDLRALVGPCIHPSCYEFGKDTLDEVVAAVGEEARGTTADGRPALDLPAAVVATLHRAGVDDVEGPPACTACDAEGRFFSHRARADAGRQATLVWVEGP
jgi:polyphenol oxidase